MSDETIFNENMCRVNVKNLTINRLVALGCVNKGILRQKMVQKQVVFGEKRVVLVNKNDYICNKCDEVCT